VALDESLNCRHDVFLETYLIYVIASSLVDLLSFMIFYYLRRLLTRFAMAIMVIMGGFPNDLGIKVASAT